MRLVLHGLSALPVLLSSYGIDKRPRQDRKVLHNCYPGADAIEYLGCQFPQINPPYCFLLPTWRRPKKGFLTFSSQHSYPTGAFCQVAHGVFVSSPELCFVQLGKQVSRTELILYGSALCGTFVIDPAAHGGLGNRRPLTTARKIARFVEQNPRLNGIVNAREALPYLIDNAASPPEIFLQMVLTLPPFLGGFGLPGCSSNHRLTLGQRAQTIAQRTTLIPDCCWPRHHLAVEYDSNAEHLTSRQITLDSTKRLALEAEGFRVITVTHDQLADPGHMQHLAHEIARSVEFRLRIRNKRFPERQNALYRRGWSLDRVFNPLWLYSTPDMTSSGDEDMGVNRVPNTGEIAETERATGQPRPAGR